MKNNHKIRKLFFPIVIPLVSFVLLMVCSINGHSQSLFQYVDKPQMTEKQQHFADAWIKYEWVKSYKYITIDNKAFASSVLNVNLPENNNIQVEQNELIERAGGILSWKGKFQKPEGNADFVVNSDMITARISTFKYVYLIYPLTNGLHVLLECDNGNMPLDESISGYKQMLDQAAKKASEKETGHFDPEATKDASKSVLAGDCKVRILVMYNDAAASNMADPIGFVNSCIDITNTAYNNSGLSFNVELAVATQETYAGALNSSVDKVRFHDNGDGYLDNVFDLRTYFDADMCVLILENLQSGICGEAYTVANSTYNDPFCVVTRGCSVGNLSFPHELGHLYGCRHDPYVDNGSTPYAYGHGYVYLPSRWRTVMAYNDLCAATSPGTGCTRIPYFSNPSVSYLGNATGVGGANNNKAALEASRANISSLETTLSDKVFVNSYTFTSGEQSDIIATSSVTNSTTFAYQSGSSGTWRSGGSIIMAPGFVASSGSKFRAFTDACAALRPTVPTNNSIVAKQSLYLHNEDNRIQLQPNPFVSAFTISFNSANETKAQINIFNSMGVKMKQIDKLGMIKGTNTINIDGSRFAKGVYLVEIVTDNTKTVKKAIKM